jgi:hypothetical protein
LTIFPYQALKVSSNGVSKYYLGRFSWAEMLSLAGL